MDSGFLQSVCKRYIICLIVKKAFLQIQLIIDQFLLLVIYIRLLEKNIPEQLLFLPKK